MKDQDTNAQPLALLRRKILLGVTLMGGLTALPATAWADKKSKRASGARPAQASKKEETSLVAQAPASPVLVPRLSPQIGGEDHYVHLPDLVRKEIVQGRAGVPMEIRFVLVDAAGAPLSGVWVDMWQCDAQGSYSQPVPGQESEDFLRGRQKTDALGLAAFQTIYPGWEPARTTHVHLKVWDAEKNGDKALYTSQCFLPDALSEYIYTHHPAYARTQRRDTFNSTDAWVQKTGNTLLGSVREEREQYVTSVALVIDRWGRNPNVELDSALGHHAQTEPEQSRPGEESVNRSALFPGKTL